MKKNYINNGSLEIEICKYCQKEFRIKTEEERLGLIYHEIDCDAKPFLNADWEY